MDGKTTLLIIFFAVVIVAIPIVIRKLANKAANKISDSIQNARAEKQNQENKDKTESLADRFK